MLQVKCYMELQPSQCWSQSATHRGMRPRDKRQHSIVPSSHKLGSCCKSSCLLLVPALQDQGAYSNKQPVPQLLQGLLCTATSTPLLCRG